MSALLDAVGIAIGKMENIQKRLMKKHRAEKVIFVITTDGYENASRKYSYEQIRRKIETKKECGWEFLFLGANIDAGEQAEKIGIKRNRSVTYENDRKGIAINFKVIGRALRKAVLCDDSEDYFDEDWMDEIQEYHEKNKKF